MRLFRLAFAAASLWASVAAAQVGMPWPGPGNPHSVGSSFTGIGDVQSGWYAYYGVIPYSGAYATALGNSFDFTCTGGAGFGTVPFQSSGALNLSGAIASCVGTVTVTNIYDQSGATRCSSPTACNLDQTPLGVIVFLQSGCPSTSVVTYCFSGTGLHMQTGSNITNQAQPFMLSAVVDRPTLARGLNHTMLGTGGTTNVILGSSSTNDRVFLYAGAGVPLDTATDGATHAVQGVFNGASSTTLVDGGTVTTASTSPGTNGFSSDTIGIGGVGGDAFTGFIYQLGLYPGTLSSGVQASIASNQSTNVGLGF